jgi:hypothetical protein
MLIAVANLFYLTTIKGIGLRKENNPDSRKIIVVFNHIITLL